MHMPRPAFKPLIVAGVLVMGLLGASGCSSHETSSQESAYCKDINQAQTNFGDLDSSDYTKLGAAFAALHQLDQEAPSSVQKDWGVVDETITDLERAVDDAGLKLSDLGDITAGNVPRGVDRAKLQRIVHKAQALASSKVTSAASNIEADAHSHCGLDVSIF
jgi:hypothetical protein